MGFAGGGVEVDQGGDQLSRAGDVEGGDAEGGDGEGGAAGSVDGVENANGDGGEEDEEGEQSGEAETAGAAEASASGGGWFAGAAIDLRFGGWEACLERFSGIGLRRWVNCRHA